MPRRAIFRPHPEVPFVPDRVLEEHADQLLAEYGAKYGPIAQPPVPIDRIVECHLKLHVEFQDLCGLFGADDISGALWVQDRRIAIDQSLDPDQYPEMEGRYHYTLGHEAAHWWLHRHLLRPPEGELLPGVEAEPPSVVCRRSQSRSPIERQADGFSACLLMPRPLLRAQWRAMRGDDAPLVVEEVARRFYGSLAAAETEIQREVVAPLARVFKVSKQAMSIRLRELGFVLPKHEPGLFGA